MVRGRHFLIVSVLQWVSYLPLERVPFRVKLHALFTVYNNCGLFLGLVLLSPVVSFCSCPHSPGLPNVSGDRSPSPPGNHGQLSRLLYPFFCTLLHFSIFSVFSWFPVSYLLIPEELLLYFSCFFPSCQFRYLDFRFWKDHIFLTVLFCCL